MTSFRCHAWLLAIGMCFFAGQVAAQTAPLSDVLNALGLTKDNVPALRHDPVARAGPFFDARLSADAKRSCASCHEPGKAWTGSVVAAAAGEPDKRAVPSLNAAGQASFLFWDGRANSLEAQVMEVLENPVEMNGSRLLAVKFSANPDSGVTDCRPDTRLLSELNDIGNEQLSSRRYRSIYERMSLDDRRAVDRSFACVAHAIAQFVRAIPYPENLWSAATLGQRDPAKENPAAFRGAIVFAGSGRCATCHYGPYMTDNQFHNIGIGDLKEADISDPGRYGAVKAMANNPYNQLATSNYSPTGAITRFRLSEEMWGAFKTPSLLQLNEIGPYMHNGKYKSIEEVVDYYDTLRGSVAPPHHYNGLIVPLHLSPTERADLIAFLKSL
ncbi:cytochrome-c peroxidase [Dyella tabacisoli]|uniref:Cytochrome c domain-containing protein n=1 Tax=Dyella tabacisoli TaxID=2282381 RepID=A0A369UK01_9GAMM|nr:cytochrome c peroxidase [Dyella tabacisoli]RDD80663.1 hypothetical protein DVJ77_15605 [Dyella tabacisoli]